MKVPRIVLMGGFGNQLFQLAFGLERYSDRQFALETSLGGPRFAENGNLDLESYLLPSRVSVINESANRLSRKLTNMVLRVSISNSPQIIKFRIVALCSLLLKITHRKNLKSVCASGVGFSELNYPKPGNNDLAIGYFQSSFFFSERTLETLRSMEHTQIIDGYGDYAAIAVKQRPIMVHVRLGDYELETGIGLLPNSYYIAAIQTARFHSPNSPIWIFSNDIPKVRDRFSDFKFEEMIFIEDHWNSAASTFEVMRLGSAYVIANSSFSYWAAMLSKAPNPLVIAPEPWFQGTVSPSKILPPEWKTIRTK